MRGRVEGGSTAAKKKHRPGTRIKNERTTHWTPIDCSVHGARRWTSPYLTAYIVIAYLGLVYVVMAYIVMAIIVMAYIVR